MRDSLDLGCAPAMEDCAQVGSDGYMDRARRECNAYIGQIQRECGPEPPGASLSIKANPHDFGMYLSVVCYFDQDCPDAVDYAFKCESHGPQVWDQEAQQELSDAPARKRRKEKML